MEGRNIKKWSNRITQDQFPMNLIKVEREGSHIRMAQSNQNYHIITHMQGWRMQGLARIYNEEGIEIAKLTFLNGIANGPCILNDNAGKMYFKGRLVDGYRQGRGKEYDELGNVMFDGFFKRGKRQNIVPSKEMKGYWKEYDEHGKLVSITQRDDFGRKEGICYFYDEEDEITRISEWKEDREIAFFGSCEIFDEPRRIWYKGHFENGYRQWRGVEYDKLGNVIFDGYYDKGKRLDNIVPLEVMKGYWKEYDEHGKLVSITQRDDFGRKEGICYFYDEEGEITRISEWKEDREISTSGYYELYDENRNDWFKGYFYKEKKLRAIPISERKRYYKEYNEENILVRICGKDKEGRYQGICYFYNTEGLINRVSYWEHGTEIKVIKQFNGSTMIEYDKEGQKCYEGGYLDSFELDYPRNGDGEEYYTDGKTLMFKGSYNNGRKHGKGKSYKNNEE